MAEWMWNTGIPAAWIYGRGGAELSEGWTPEKEAELKELQIIVLLVRLAAGIV